MRVLPQILHETRTGPAVRTVASVALIMVCAVEIILPLSAQGVSSASPLHVTVRDTNNRFVVGLEQEDFRVLENGVERPITLFSAVDSAISIAIIDAAAMPADVNDPPTSHAKDEVIETQSVSQAVRQLVASRNSRKAIVLAGAADTESV